MPTKSPATVACAELPIRRGCPAVHQKVSQWQERLCHRQAECRRHPTQTLRTRPHAGTFGGLRPAGAQTRHLNGTRPITVPIRTARATGTRVCELARQTQRPQLHIRRCTITFSKNSTQFWRRYLRLSVDFEKCPNSVPQSRRPRPIQAQAVRCIRTLALAHRARA